MGHGSASVERGECRKRQVSAARGYGSSDGEDTGSAATTAPSVRRENRAEGQTAKDSEEKKKTAGKQCTDFNSEKTVDKSTQCLVKGRW